MPRYLPLGTVVLLKDSETKIFIIGYFPKDESGKVWDYLGCKHPIGVTESEARILFDEEQIEKTIHLGYSDKEGMDYRHTLSKENN